MTPRRFFLLLGLLAFAGVPVARAAPPPVKVFVLAGQSNMEGQAVADLGGKNYNDGKGTLKALLNDPVKGKLVKHLTTPEGGWAVRDDVWVRYQREKQPLLAGPLSVGFSVYGGTHHFGPELQFGHVVGDHFAEPVLLIKAAWGGKSLYKDFRPPSSGGAVGPYYTKMLDEVRAALADLKTDFPTYAGQGYELAGFVWYQGWNDGVDPKAAVPEYEQNLVNLIKDVRKEWKAPNLPVVVGELTGAWVDAPGAWAALRAAQAAAAARPEFKGTVLFVPTRDFVRPANESPHPGHGHHEFGNAETYFLVGDALGKGVVKLLAPPKKDEKPEPPKPTSRTDRTVEGWTVRVDDRLLQAPNVEAGTRALRFLENKLSDIKVVVPADKVKKLQAVTIVLDLTHGNLGSMQYHPSAGWLKSNGYAADLAKCVHLPRAADVATKRNVNEQPWVILHELAHAYHDQVLGFDEPRIKEAYEAFKKSGRGDKTLLFNGTRVRHYALTTPMEFFAEMTEAYFGVNDFFPFNRAELKEAEPEIFELLTNIWDAPPAKTPAGPKPMNVVVLLADDWRHDTLGCAGHPVLKTPHLDALAAGGVRFTRACVTTSICGVSRASLLTGQWMSRHGNEAFAMFQTPWAETFPGLLRANGYWVGHVGKWHNGAFPKDKYDFGRSYAGTHWVKRGGAEPVHVTKLNEADALEFLRTRPADKPFCLTVAFFAAHAEDGNPKQYLPQPDSAALYADATIPVPPTATDEALKRLPPFLQLPANEGRKRFGWRFDTPEKFQTMMKNYYRLCSEVDAACGRVLAELKAQGVLDNTLVVFTGDNGYFHGERGLADKWYPYEESIRVPLIVSDPRQPAGGKGKTNGDFVLNVDIAPTILAAANVAAPATMQGRDFAPLYRAAKPPAPPWRDEFFYEHAVIGSKDRIPASQALVRHGAKYIRWPDFDYEEYFDLKADPHEQTNLAGDPTHAEPLAVARRRLAELKLLAK